MFVVYVSPVLLTFLLLHPTETLRYINLGRTSAATLLTVVCVISAVVFSQCSLTHRTSNLHSWYVFWKPAAGRGSSKPAAPRLTRACMTVLRLLHERGLGTSSPFYSYLSVLPHNHRLPLEWNETELELLQVRLAQYFRGYGCAFFAREFPPSSLSIHLNRRDCLNINWLARTMVCTLVLARRYAFPPNLRFLVTPRHSCFAAASR